MDVMPVIMILSTFVCACAVKFVQMVVQIFTAFEKLHTIWPFGKVIKSVVDETWVLRITYHSPECLDLVSRRAGGDASIEQHLGRALGSHM